MRLNGVKEILEYVGYSAKNHQAWHEVKRRYGALIRHTDNGRPWATSEEVDAFDIERCPTAAERNLSRRNGRAVTVVSALSSYRRTHPRCEICGWSIEGTSAVHVHHVIPLSRGGNSSEENLITLCPNHHALAHVRTDDSRLSLVLRLLGVK